MLPSEAEQRQEPSKRAWLQPDDGCPAPDRCGMPSGTSRPVGGGALAYGFHREGSHFHSFGNLLRSSRLRLCGASADRREPRRGRWPCIRRSCRSASRRRSTYWAARTSGPFASHRTAARVRRSPKPAPASVTCRPGRTETRAARDGAPIRSRRRFLPGHRASSGASCMPRSGPAPRVLAPSRRFA